MMSRAFRFGLALSWMGLLAGCSTMDVFKWNPDGVLHAGPKNPVSEIVAIWQPGEGTGLDEKMTRGFVGQIYFFTPNSPAPAVVDGTVRIYVFDDQGGPEEQVKPIHQFDFSPEAWKTHMGKGKLGPTYSVFIPYTRKGFHEARCTLRVRLMQKSAATYYSEMASITLPGAKTKGGVKKAGEASPQVAQQQQPPAPLTNRSPAAAKPAQGARSAESIQDMVAAMNRTVPEPKRPNAVRLTQEERDRIIREARLKLTETRESKAAPVEETEEVSVPMPARRQTAPKKPIDDDVDLLPPAEEKPRESAAADPKSLLPRAI